MKKLKVTILLLFISVSNFAQEKDILFSLNGEPVSVSEFKRVYEKNLDLVDDEAKNIDKNLELYINYKLKVQEAYTLRLDTSKTYQRELKMYKEQLIAPYLQDKNFQKKQIQEAYKRTKEEVRASHILILFPKKKDKLDTIEMLTKLEDARMRILNGEDFGKVAKEVSEDPSAKINGGDLGFFSAFKMVYPFEEAAYKTELGQVSKPFKTRFGYHILKVTAKRKSKGEFEVAHILATDKSIIGKVKIDSAYQQLEKGKSFEEVVKLFSDDKGTSNKGGRLAKFGTGSMVEPFENEVLQLQNEGDYSKPFRTRYGWHIVKLIKNYPVLPFDDVKEELIRKVKSSGRGTFSTDVVVNRLKKEYSIKENEEVLTNILKGKDLFNDQVDLVTINEKKLAVKDFNAFSKYRKRTPIKQLYKEFLDQEILNYFKENLEKTSTDFKYTLQEYKDGLLLFDLMQQKIWNKSVTDTLGLKKYFETHKNNYKEASLNTIKGEVTNDYQKDLDNNWIKELRKNNVVKIRKKVLKKFKKIYNQ
ncbi:peptidyl-prolyl cis-trans isomerase SurA [Tenacibaculum adriaticum]|uniref:Peptidyl-prolyl cis-trans isomerase SurA n=1 Tax=Tenacibaculum adriaticum TaxID=413713 RepID=A0A5S5DVB1_9FLAO|nr:peptidylprolyl isomerase [Tenacibaculum adriaticum]TYP98712.1 peptidyl-prolyl cis-trans isomerase SurA [Tenacibaculum adriaticum]